MILVAVVDDRMGLCFHGRRQSQDKRLREKILTLFAGKTLWMNGYSAKQFAKDAGADAICVAEDFLTQAGKGEICFVENISAASAAGGAGVSVPLEPSLSRRPFLRPALGGRVGTDVGGGVFRFLS